ncbi:MAG: efflux RND transporter periplasmic adaptor subunit [Bacteroidales bacterium]|jgi:RND family efflux transporter MFP subunit
MKNSIFFITIITFFLIGCNSNTVKTENQEKPKIQITAYSDNFELYAEADPFVTGKASNLLSHFSHLPSFKALETGIMTVSLNVNGKVISQTLDKPTRKGIYSFDLTPQTEGSGNIVFEIKTEKGVLVLQTSEITVYSTEQEANEAAKKAVKSKTNTTVFTKEQTWKLDFASELPKVEPFGQVIKTTARIQSAQGDEIIVSAKANGTVIFAANNILEGKNVSMGNVLFTISDNGLTNNNISVQYAEAKNNYEKAKSDYERVKELAKDKIMSEKELLNARNIFDNARVVYENLNKNFSTSGQKVSCPISGFIKQIFVKNGSFVEAGQPVFTISQNKTLIISAELQQKYTTILGSIISANIRTLWDNKTYTLGELNGKLLSFGKATNNDNYLIPVNLQIDNKGSFIPGGFVEVYLKTMTNSQALTIPCEALLEEQGIFFVYVQITPELFEKREVKTGATDGLRTEILSGIAQNERIISKGAIMVKLAQATGTLDAHSGHVH